MASNLYNTMYNPDVLSCIANLSNDEVFTPPEVANAMLDLLPQELFSDPNATFLDPAAKSGVFLREIAKRLLNGLEPIYPDLQERTDHIFKHQLYGIAITELTSHLSRRSLYCSKTANGNYSVTHFDTIDGNIRFKNIQHRWKDGRCVFCGASQKEYDREAGLETHAYEWIHTIKPEEIFKMKFDVIIGNPPYQLSDGGNAASASPLYHLFVQQAMKLNPRYLTMIIPARWYAGGKGLDDFRTTMLHDGRIRTLVDFFDSTDCFPGVDISGGICYFLWERDNKGECEVISFRDSKKSVLTRPLLEENEETFIRFNEAITILEKIKKANEPSFGKNVSSRKPFGFSTNPESITQMNKDGYVPIFAYPQNGFVKKSLISKNIEWLPKYKVCDAKAYGERGKFPYNVIAKPFIAGPQTCCSETYIVLGAYDSIKEAQNVLSYLSTKFVRFLILIKKNTQDAPARVYQLIPLQDFSKPWTDEELYAKYDLTNDEIAFIESMIKPMDLGGDD